MSYFNISRSLLESDTWLSEKFTRGQAWIDLIGHARWKAGHCNIGGRRINLERGQLCWSILQLGKRWKWSYNKVKRFLNELSDDNQIDYQNITVTTLISITNYTAYQEGERPDRRPDERPDESPDERQKKKGKKDKKENKVTVPAIPSLDFELIIDLFASKCPSQPKPQGKQSKPRMSAITARYKELGGTMDNWKSFCERIESSDFLSGRDNGWRCGIDWALKPANFTKIIEGNYDQRKPAYKGAKTEHKTF